MTPTARSRRNLAHGLTGALATVLLAGCTTQAAPRADVSASRAEAALAKGKHERAIEHAEAAVQAEPRNAAYRAMLGDAYLEAGRFVSAVSTFGDAVALGDRSARTALSQALALTGAGLGNEAIAVLNAHEGQIATSDLGLALALAGWPERGVQLLENGIRFGENTMKMRQNLAYSYALAGRWREARMMVSQDLSADRVNDRIEEWSRTAHPLAWHDRVARLLDVPANVPDPGQPVQLALANHPSIDQLAAEAVKAAATLPAPAPSVAADPITAELPPLLAVAPVGITPPAPRILPPAAPTVVAADEMRSRFDTAFATQSAEGALPSLAAQQAVRAVLSAPAESRPVPAPRPAPATPPAARAKGTHLVQLGSFSSRESAERGQAIFARRHPQLSGHPMVITEAIVNGKRYWRVSAADFGAGDSRALCGSLRAQGQGCLAYAEARPLPGTVGKPIMLARR